MGPIINRVMKELKVKEDSKKEALAEHILHDVLLPHILDVDNWSVDSLQALKCKPIACDAALVDSPRMESVYTLAMDKASELLESGSNLRLTLKTSGLPQSVEPQIYSCTPFREIDELSDQMPSLDAICQHVWDRDGAAYEAAVEDEVHRLGDFVSVVDNWDGHLMTTKPFRWSERIIALGHPAKSDVENIMQARCYKECEYGIYFVRPDGDEGRDVNVKAIRCVTVFLK